MSCSRCEKDKTDEELLPLLPRRKKIPRICLECDKETLICPHCKLNKEKDCFVTINSKRLTHNCSECREKMRAYGKTEANAIKRKEYNKKYYQDIFKPRFKEYYEANKDKYAANSKKFYETVTKLKPKVENSPRLSLECECGGKYQIVTRSRHFRTKKHMEFLITIEEIVADLNDEGEEGESVPSDSSISDVDEEEQPGGPITVIVESLNDLSLEKVA